MGDITFLFGWAKENNVPIPKKPNGETDIVSLFELYDRDKYIESLEKKSAKDISQEQKIDIKTMAKNIVETFYGPEFTGVKGQAAIDKLLKEKKGHVKGAFYRSDLGYIDLVWGNEHAGLCHIIERRTQQGINVSDFIADLAEVVEKGQYKGKTPNNTFEFWYNGKMVIISPEYKNNKVVFLLTAFKRQKNKASANAVAVPIP